MTVFAGVGQNGPGQPCVTVDPPTMISTLIEGCTLMFGATLMEGATLADCTTLMDGATLADCATLIDGATLTDCAALNEGPAAGWVNAVVTDGAGQYGPGHTYVVACPLTVVWKTLGETLTDSGTAAGVPGTTIVPPGVGQYGPGHEYTLVCSPTIVARIVGSTLGIPPAADSVALCVPATAVDSEDGQLGPGQEATVADIFFMVDKLSPVVDIVGLVEPGGLAVLSAIGQFGPGHVITVVAVPTTIVDLLPVTTFEAGQEGPGQTVSVLTAPLAVLTRTMTSEGEGVLIDVGQYGPGQATLVVFDPTTIVEL